MIKQKYPSINGLRFFSIVLVILEHVSYQNNFKEIISGYKWIESLALFFTDGGLGVQIFFVISGFLITSLLENEEIQSSSVSIKKFYIRRVLRIFPAYYFLLLVYFFLQAINVIHISNTSWITAITYTKYLNHLSEWYTAHSWSLSLEELFYFFWPLIFISGKRIRKTTVMLIILSIPILRVYLHYNPDSWTPLFIFRRVDAIATGCLIALYKDEIIKVIKPYFSIVFYLSIASLFLLRYFPIILNKLNLLFILVPLELKHGTIANVLISIILLYSVFGPQRIWFNILNLKVLNYFGLLSYSLYLWQQLFTSQLNYWVIKFPQNIIFIIAISMFSYHIIEKPFLKLKSKFS